LSKPVAKSSNNKLKSTSQLRIIGGRWRGRKLNFPDVEGLRPTGDRIRETLFNWLAPDIQEARVLDLFAGSGALGLEALSRGAAYSLLLEKNSAAAGQLNANLVLLQSTKGKVQQQDALTWLSQHNQAQPFDLVFIDPPFQLNLWQVVIDLLEKGNYLAKEAVIYVESGKNTVYQAPSNWLLHRDKTAGNVCYRLFYRGNQNVMTEDEQP
jgi:16S rRNA (guanine966-N2)-methyltransferase